MQRNINPGAQRKYSTGRRGGISKAHGYLLELFSWEHDLQHMIVAFGSKRVRDQITLIEEQMHGEAQAKKGAV